jgi:hypothetical protein
MVRKPFADFLAESVAVEAGREDEPIAEVMQLQVIEVAPGDWRLRMVLDHEVEIVGDESFSTQEEALEVVLDRIEDGMDEDGIEVSHIQ